MFLKILCVVHKFCTLTLKTKYFEEMILTISKTVQDCCSNTSYATPQAMFVNMSCFLCLTHFN